MDIILDTLSTLHPINKLIESNSLLISGPSMKEIYTGSPFLKVYNILIDK